MNLQEIIKYQKEFDSTHKGNFKWDQPIDDNSIDMLEFLMLSLVGEMGETSNIIKKIVRGDFKLSEKKAEISEEIIDMFIYIIKLSYQLDIDIEQEYLKKMESNKERFQHYEQYKK